MSPITFSNSQRSIISSPISTTTFLEGSAGTGKTSAAVERLLFLMEHGIPGNTILLLVPQRSLATPYINALQSPGVIAGGTVSIQTIAGLAKQLIELFWPLVVRQAGFGNPHSYPTFLNLETAQYFMSRIVQPLLEQGYFDTVTINRNRIYSQILDNLNKSAVVGFSYIEIGERLKSAWPGEPSQLRVYDDTQECATQFRKFCLEHNLLDFSLQIELFKSIIWDEPACQKYLLDTYKHLIYDNTEEDAPTTHEFVKKWISEFDSVLLIYDHDAGYRRFLGADPVSAYTLKAFCSSHIEFIDSFSSSPAIISLTRSLEKIISPSQSISLPSETEVNTANKFTPALAYTFTRFYPQMLDWVCEQINLLVNEQGMPPGDIAILAPYMSDALRFLLVNRLESYQIQARSHRPSRSLMDEPATHCLLTLASLAYPQWGFIPTKYDITNAMIQAIAEMDLVRARILTDMIYRVHQDQPILLPFDQVTGENQSRITYLLGNRYDHLRNWIMEYSQNPLGELDYFLRYFFSEVLSQPGYKFHYNLDAARVTANLADSFQNFRWIAGNFLEHRGTSIGKEYITMLQEGVIAAQYLRSWQDQEADAVFIAPAYTFLLRNTPVEYQFWLDIGNRSWYERLFQPITHPYVLSQQWPPQAKWTDADEVSISHTSLIHLVTGLLRRCRQGIYIGMSQLNEQGYEQRGSLLHAFHKLFQST